ncbi:MAG: DinB family protein [Flavobacteriales bacterium]|nr:DinB family protein [Flavobacteriales bacterium]
MMTEAQILARQLDKARELTKWYLSLMKESDPYKTFEWNGKRFNSIIWEIGHLAMSENFLANYLTYGPSVKEEWFKNFAMGGDNQVNDDYPDFKTVLESFKQIHITTIEHISKISDEELDQPTKKEFNVAGIVTVRDAIIHSIRHESTHTGHLGWLCKLHDIKTV